MTMVVTRSRGTALPNMTLATYAHPVGLHDILDALTLVHPIGAQLNSVLWSLRWEVAFSLALPLVVLMAPVLRRQALLLGVAAVIVVWGSWIASPVTVLAPFAVGVALALREDAIVRLRDRLAGRRLWPVLLPVAAVLLTADVWLPGAYAYRGAGLAGALVVVGAALLVLGPLLDPAIEQALCRAPVQWVGRRSYSLYLTHQPIVVSLAFALGAPPFWILLPAALLVALPMAALFYRAVERPSQRLSRAAGHAVAARRRAPATVAVEPT
jgi:peptidoglycan/LPS O-acetylase OafA/YrhL